MNQREWEEKYRAGEAHWDHGAASPGLVDFLGEHRELPRGRVAVPGCGTGHDVRAWAKFGFGAHGFDVAPTAIQLAVQETRAAGLQALFTRCDFLKETPPEPFDYLWEHTLFCALQPDLRDQYVRAVKRWLKPGGTYVAMHYIVCGPDGPPWPVTLRELWQRFLPDFHLLGQWVPRSYASRCGREHMLWWRRI